MNKSDSPKKNNIFVGKGKSYTVSESGAHLNFSLFPTINSNKKYKYDFFSISLLIFCPCLRKSKILKKEYDYLYNKLKDYCDFVKVTRLMMEIKEGAENMRKNINEINNNIQLNEQFYKNNNNKKFILSPNYLY